MKNQLLELADSLIGTDGDRVQEAAVGHGQVDSHDFPLLGRHNHNAERKPASPGC